jgi:hypothetical protein
MSDYTKILIILGSLFLCSKFLSPDVKEGYFGVGPAQTVKVQQNAMGPSGNMYTIPGNYQAMLSPRMSNVNYGAFIRYNMPNTNMLAADPANPMSLKNMVYQPPQAQIKERYCGSSQGYQGQPIGTAASNLSQFGNQQLKYNEATDMLPVQAMGGQMVNALGEAESQPIIYDRFIYANQKSRLYGLGDPIRGDLPIVPNNNGWFQVSVSPSIDLNSGAIMAMAGANNDTQKELMALRSASTAGLLNVGSGINYSVMQSPFTTGAGGDVQISSFP